MSVFELLKEKKRLISLNIKNKIKHFFILKLQRAISPSPPPHLLALAATHLVRHGRPSKNLLVPTPSVQKTINLLPSNKRLGPHGGANRKALKL